MAVHQKGRLRGSDSGRGWHATLYSPTASCRYWRARFKDQQTGEWVTRQAPSSEQPEVEKWFREIEHALDAQVITPAPRSTARPTMRMLAARYMDWLISAGRDADYRHTVENILEVWVLRTDGDLAVASWTPTHTQRWIGAARNKGLSSARVENLGVALSGMRKAAWRRGEDGLRWLERSNDPLEDIEYSRRITEEGAHRDYIPPSARPTTPQVASLLEAVDEDCPWPWMPTQVRIGVFCGPRLGEQMALRAVDVDFGQRQLEIRNAMSWPKPSREKTWGIKATKTGRRRHVPYPKSIHEPLLALCRTRLGLAPDAPEAAVTAAQDVHYQKLAALDEENLRSRMPRPISPHEVLLFDRGDGLPPTKERYGELWRPIRARSEWPTTIPWMNARHHCASWWPSMLRDTPLDEEDFARWLGHSVRTHLNHYRRAGSDSNEIARPFLDEL